MQPRSFVYLLEMLQQLIEMPEAIPKVEKQQTLWTNGVRILEIFMNHIQFNSLQKWLIASDR